MHALSHSDCTQNVWSKCMPLHVVTELPDSALQLLDRLAKLSQMINAQVSMQMCQHLLDEQHLHRRPRHTHFDKRCKSLTSARTFTLCQDNHTSAYKCRVQAYHYQRLGLPLVRRLLWQRGSYQQARKSVAPSITAGPAPFHTAQLAGLMILPLLAHTEPDLPSLQPVVAAGP